MELVLALLLSLIAIFLFILAVIMEIYNDGTEEYDNAVMTIFAISIVFFWVAGACFFFITETVIVEEAVVEHVLSSYNSIGWLHIALSFIPIVFLGVKATNLLGQEEE